VTTLQALHRAHGALPADKKEKCWPPEDQGPPNSRPPLAPFKFGQTRARLTDWRKVSAGRLAMGFADFIAVDLQRRPWLAYYTGFVFERSTGKATCGRWPAGGRSTISSRNLAIAEPAGGGLRHWRLTRGC